MRLVDDSQNDRESDQKACKTEKGRNCSKVEERLITKDEARGFVERFSTLLDYLKDK